MDEDKEAKELKKARKRKSQEELAAAKKSKKELVDITAQKLAWSADGKA